MKTDVEIAQEILKGLPVRKKLSATLKANPPVYEAIFVSAGRDAGWLEAMEWADNASMEEFDSMLAKLKDAQPDDAGLYHNKIHKDVGVSRVPKTAKVKLEGEVCENCGGPRGDLGHKVEGSFHCEASDE